MDDDRLRHRLAEVMAGAGLGYNSISQEILYLLPKDFISQYISLWEKALGSAGDGDRPGQRMARDANLEKSSGKLKRGGKREGGAVREVPHVSGGGKKFNRMGLSIKNEKALRLKDRIDRRLRSIARDIEAELELIQAGSGRKGGGRGQNGEDDEGGIDQQWRCPSCGRIGDRIWIHCPFDGSLMVLIQVRNQK